MTSVAEEIVMGKDEVGEEQGNVVEVHEMGGRWGRNFSRTESMGVRDIDI